MKPELEIYFHADSHVFSDSVINISILLLVIRFQNFLSFKTSPVSKLPKFQNLFSFKTCNSQLFLPMSFHSISHQILLILLENTSPLILQVSHALVTSRRAYLWSAPADQSLNWSTCLCLSHFPPRLSALMS